jgi:hypothetical protein
LPILLLAVMVSHPAASRAQGSPSSDSRPAHYSGWAVEAYPELSAPEMEAIVQRMAQAGANVVWIGHNNPGEVDAEKIEPGLSYAVYEAFLNQADPRHAAAQAIVAAQQRMLAACRTVGLRAVLPVGYQIQMGLAWNKKHPNDLRRDAAGRLLNIYGGGISASFYSPSYQRDIETYYRWVDAEFVRPYADVLLMLNLADEPIGGDYSAYAQAEFQRRHGFGFDEVGNDPARQELLGSFQSHYVVEYATYSARLWQQIHPGLPLTMSFDGAQARKTFTLPHVEALFRDTPDNFVVTLDAYPQDALPRIPLDDKNLSSLFLLARSLGLYSALYDKPVWLWAAANSWGLSQASSDPGTISDAVANGIYLALLVGQGGGDLRGLVYWNYNVKEQGLYNDTRVTAYDPEAMFCQVSAGLRPLRSLMREPRLSPQVLILAPPAVADRQMGATREAVRLEVQPYDRLVMLARSGVNAAVVSSLAALVPPQAGSGGELDGIRAIIVLSPSPSFLATEELAALRRFLSQGGKLVTSPGVGAVLADATARAELVYGDLVERRGNLYLAQKGIAVLFEDKRHETLSGFWQEVLGLSGLQPGYRIVAYQTAFHYHLGPEPVTVDLSFPYEVQGSLYDEQARPIAPLAGAAPTIELQRREYIVLHRIWHPPPSAR